MNIERSKKWKMVRLGDVANVVGGFAFKGEHFGDVGLPVVKITEIVPPYVSFEKAQKIDISNYSDERLKKFKLKKGDYVVAMTGATIGKVGKIVNDIEALLNQRVARIYAKEGYDDKYVYYQVFSPSFLKYIQQISAGSSAQQNISSGAIEGFEFKIPELLSEQKEIADILSSLDDKIELLEKENKTLENIAQTIFKEWFVDFRFPGVTNKMADSELGRIPDGWIVYELKDIFRFIKGKKPLKTTLVQQDGYLPQILIENLDGRGSIFGKNEKVVVCNSTDLLMVMDGASSGRIEFGHEGIVGSTLSKLEFNFPVHSIIYFFLKNIEKYIKDNTTGSAIPHTNKDMVGLFKITLPKNTESAESFFKSIMQKIILNRKEEKSLSSVRDSILNKIFSA